MPKYPLSLHFSLLVSAKIAILAILYHSLTGNRVSKIRQIWYFWRILLLDQHLRPSVSGHIWPHLTTYLLIPYSAWNVLKYDTHNHACMCMYVCVSTHLKISCWWHAYSIHSRYMNTCCVVVLHAHCTGYVCLALPHVYIYATVVSCAEYISGCTASYYSMLTRARSPHCAQHIS